MAPGTLNHAIDRVATAVVLLAILLFLGKKLASYLPFHVPMRFVAGVAGLAAVVALFDALGRRAPLVLVASVLVVGLVVFVVWRWVSTAKLRETRKQQLEQARGRERRRAPAPLPPGTNGGTP